MDQRYSFELFKNVICHRIKREGVIDFLIGALETDEIRKYFHLGWYPESLYLLAMMDYLCRLQKLPLCSRYDDLRSKKLSDPIYPSSILVLSAVSRNGDEIKAKAHQNAIPEFLRFNIVEGDLEYYLIGKQENFRRRKRL